MDFDPEPNILSRNTRVTSGTGASGPVLFSEALNCPYGQAGRAFSEVLAATGSENKSFSEANRG